MQEPDRGTPTSSRSNADRASFVFLDHTEFQPCPSADSLAGNGQPRPLVIGQPDPSVTELFEKDAVIPGVWA